MSPVACRRPRSCWQALLLAAAALAAGPASAAAEWSIGIQVPGISIGVNVPRYPQLVPVPGFPVYYAPEVRSNFFFYDGVYWVYQGDRWYASTWYNGPWGAVSPDAVPWSVLRVPVRYYRSPPPHFRGWQREAPPRWEEHWGPEWHGPRDGWRRDEREASEPRSPLTDSRTAATPLRAAR